MRPSRRASVVRQPPWDPTEKGLYGDPREITRMTPETRYARSGDVNIAYQVVGDGPLDLVLVPAGCRTSRSSGRTRACARFLERLASFSRLILFDKRGTGLSDRVGAAESRDADGRRPGRDGCGRVGTGGALRLSRRAGRCAHFSPPRTPIARRRSSCTAAYARRQTAPDYPWAPTAGAQAASLDDDRAELGRSLSA